MKNNLTNPSTEKYILWDLDGTIVNSEDVDFKNKIFSFASNKTGLVFELTEDQYIGQTGMEVFRSVLKSNVTNVKDLIGAFNIWESFAIASLKENIGMVQPRENVVEIWKTCFKMGIKQAVVTSSYEDIATQYLKNSGLYEMCTSITSLEHVKLPKPDPEPYHLTMSNINVQASSCIAIEDSYTGVRSAKSAGIYTIAWVKDIEDDRFSIADVVTKDLTIDAIIRGLFPHA